MSLRDASSKQLGPFFQLRGIALRASVQGAKQFFSAFPPQPCGSQAQSRTSMFKSRMSARPEYRAAYQTPALKPEFQSPWFDRCKPPSTEPHQAQQVCGT